MLKISLNNSYIQLNKKCYRQKQELPMGNTLSPFLADLYMQDYIEKYMKDIYEQGKFWRYVDDLLFIAKMNKEETTDYLKRLNKIRSKIRFTFKYEKDWKLNFLDTSLSHGSNNNIITYKMVQKTNSIR